MNPNTCVFSRQGLKDCDHYGIKVKLFFCITSHKGEWHGLLTINLDLSFERSYKIYSTR
jgi:hypothetical protein